MQIQFSDLVEETTPALRIADTLLTIDRHLEYRRKAGHSVTFQSQLKWFLRWLRLTQTEGNGTLSPSDFVQFHRWLTTIRARSQNKPLRRDTRRQILKRVRSALRWGFEAGTLPYDYSAWVPGIKPNGAKEALTFDDFEIDEFEILNPGDETAPVHSSAQARAWLEIFLNAKRLRGLSEVTLQNYHDRVDTYLRYIDAHDNLHPFSTHAAELFIAHRSATTSKHTVFGDYRTLSVFMNWLVKRGYLEAGTSPLAQIEPPRKSYKRMRYVTYDQFQRLYQSIEGDSWIDRRDRAILYILFYSGLRAGEILTLRVDDIERNEGCLYIRKGKGDKDRLTPFHPDLPWLIDGYLAARPAFDNDSLFVSSNNHGGIRGPMKYEALREMLRRRCKAARLPSFNLHSFRHGFAMTFLNNGFELSALARSMGHSSTTTTEGYARWTSNGLRSAYLAVLARFADNADGATG